MKIDSEIKSLIRSLLGDEYEKLKESILEQGIRDPLVTWNGILLDGHHRYQIAQEYGLEYKTVEIELPDREAAKEWVIKNQLGRRNLTPEEVSYYRGKLYESRKLSHGGERKSSAQNEHLKTAEQIGKEYGVNQATVRRDAEFSVAVDKVAAKLGEDAKQAILSGQANIPKREVETLLEIKQEAPELIEPVLQGKMTVTQAKREITHKQRITASPLPSNKYRVIYADPPWAYNDNRSCGTDEFMRQYTAAETYYPSMPIEELCQLNVPEICEDNAVLFLWVTSPLLEDAFKVIKAWGFSYKTSFVWDKVKHNMGHYNSVRHEFLLVCTKGSCTPDNRILFDSVQSVERSNIHSEKPEEFRNIIDTLYTHGNKIELFARTKHDNWEVWGNEPKIRSS